MAAVAKEDEIQSAPVCVFAYRRPRLLSLTLNALAQCNGAENTILRIYIDGPKNESEKEIIHNTFEIAKQVDNFIFKDVNIFLSDKNKGLAKSIIAGVSDTINEYGSVIVLEDDLVPSIDFLDYMNSSLQKYRDVSNVGSISGFGFLVNNNTKYTNYFHRRPTTWGWATWHNRWMRAVWDLSNEDELSKRHFKKEFNRGGQDLYRMLKNYLRGNIDSWGIRWAYTHYKYHWLAAAPICSKVINHGYGDDGTNCNNATPPPVNYESACCYSVRLRDDAIESKEVAKQVDWYNSNLYKLLDKIKRLVVSILIIFMLKK
jgi:hypothetical protein